MQHIYIMGDTHGEWDRFNETTASLLAPLGPGDTLDIVVCGDFGYWPRFDRFDLSKINTNNGLVRVYFCPGNHEDWDALEEFPKDSITEVHPHIFYCPFGTTKEFHGKTFMFCGGAASVDADMRTANYDWFPQEIITESDIYNLPLDKKIDVIISHTAPTSIASLFNMPIKLEDPSTAILESIKNTYVPTYWFFGHFHEALDAYVWSERHAIHCMCLEPHDYIPASFLSRT